MQRRDFLGFGLAAAALPAFGYENIDEAIANRKYEMANHKDVYADPRDIPLINEISNKLTRLKRQIGYPRFALLGWNDAIIYQKRCNAEFTLNEKKFLERLFYFDASNYGFFGSKPVKEIDYNVPGNETVRIGDQFIYRGKSLQTWMNIRQEVGPTIVLTSGVRGVMKQLDLFLNKVRSVKYNYSLASRSIAPPGFSYHGVGDFDVGKIGFGLKNFTPDFALTGEYERLVTLKIIKVRYFPNNPYGVYFEPWHIKVV